MDVWRKNVEGKKKKKKKKAASATQSCVVLDHFYHATRALLTGINLRKKVASWIQHGCHVDAHFVPAQHCLSLAFSQGHWISIEWSYQEGMPLNRDPCIGLRMRLILMEGD